MCQYKEFVILRQHVLDLHWKEDDNATKVGIIIACQQCGKMFKQWFIYRRNEKEALNEKIDTPFTSFDVRRTYPTT